MKNKKHISFFAVVLIAALLVCALGVSAFAAENITVGNVTLKDTDVDGYYEISSEEELYAFAAHVNAGNTSINAKLTADIVIPEGKKWTSIEIFDGTFDGAGYSISGLNGKNGLFASANSGAQVKNLTLKDSEIDGTGTDYVGAIAGVNKGDVFNIIIEDSVTVNGRSYVGGIVGLNYHVVYNVFSAAGVNGTGSYAGTAIGYNAGTANKIYAIGIESSIIGDAEGANVYTVENGDASSGKLAYMMGLGQKLGEGGDAYPSFKTDAPAVYRYYEGGVCTKVMYTNETLDEFTSPDMAKHEHVSAEQYSGIGFCKICRFPEAPEGKGTKDEPFLIDNAGKLYWFAGAVNSATEENKANYAHAKLTADVKMNTNVLDENGNLNGSGFTAWTPIGNSTYQYKGTFDGAGYTVRGLYFNNSSANNVGLFGYVDTNGVVKNVGVVDSYFHGLDYVGGVVGINKGIVQNCYNAGTVSAERCVSGVVAVNRGTVHNCYNTGTVSGTRSHIGGVVGDNNGMVENCYNTGTVSGYTQIGGVVAVNRGTVHNCYNTGTVSGTSDYVGGVVGYNGGTVENCYYLYTSFAGPGIGGGEGKAEATAKDSSEFTNGEVAYLLGSAFGQTLDGTNSTYPTLGGTKVYANIYCGSGAVYTNNAAEVHAEFIDENGDLICDFCRSYKMPEGDGTEEKPYLIGTASELYWFAQRVNTGDIYAYAKLTADIVVNKGVLDENGELNGTPALVWTPICIYHYYNGTFDGDGHTVSGLYCSNTDGNYGGFFASNNGTVKNLGIVDSYFYDDDHIGGVVGFNGGTVENCYNAGTIISNIYAGGVVGWNNGTVQNCYNTGTVSATASGDAYYYVGSMVGYNGGTVENCYYLSDEENDDIDGTTAKTKAQFALGEVAWLLNGNGNTEDDAFGQKLGEDKFPVLLTEGNEIYRYIVSAKCTDKEDTYVYVYANEKTADNITHDENAEIVNGLCINCSYAAIPEKISASNYYRYGFTPFNWAKYDGYYAITNAGELYSFAELVNGGEMGINAVLVNNIVVNTDVLDENGNLNSEVSNFKAWITIGNVNTPYIGTFDGVGHTVSGLYLNDETASYVGLFGYVGTDGIINNVGVVDSYFSGKNYIGGVVGWNNGTVENCYNEGTTSGTESVGGVVGENNGTVENCYNIGEVNGTNSEGGVVGWNNGTVENCYYLAESDDGNGGKTDAQFKSGEVAYLLGSAFGQTIDGVSYPSLGGAKVYYDETTGTYSNTPPEGVPAEHEHDKQEDGTCSGCGEQIVASVGDKYYTDIKEAAEAGGTVILHSNVYGDVYLTGNATINLNGYSLGGVNTTPVAMYMLRSTGAEEQGVVIIEAASEITFINGIVEGKIYNKGTMTIGEQVQLLGAIENENTVIIASAIIQDELAFEKTGIIQVAESYRGQFRQKDFDAITLLDLNPDLYEIKAYDDGTIVKVGFEYENEFVYNGNDQRPSEVELYRNGKHSYTYFESTVKFDGNDYTNVGTKKFTLNITGFDMIDGGRFELEYEIVKGDVEISDVTYKYPYLATPDKGNITGATIVIKGNGIPVMGTWSAITEKDGKYYATFTPNNVNLNSLEYELTETDAYKFTAIKVSEFKLTNVPAELLTGTWYNLSVAAAHPDMGTPVTEFDGNVKYYYSFSEDGSNATEFDGKLYVSADDIPEGAENVYVWAVAEGEYFTKAETAKEAIALRKTADMLGDLDKAVERLNKLLEGNEGVTLADILKAIEDVNNNLSTAIGEAKTELIGKFNTAIKELNTAIEELNTKLGAEITANKEGIAALNTAIDGMKATLGTLATKDELDGAVEELDGAVEELETSLESLSGTVGGIEKKLTEAEKKIEELGTKVGELEKLVTDGVAKPSEITAAIEQIKGFGETVKKLEADLAALGVKDGEIEASITALSGKVTTLETELNSVKERLDKVDVEIKDIKEKIDTLDTLIADGKIDEVKENIKEINAAIERLKEYESDSKFTAIEGEIATLEASLAAITGRIEAIEKHQAELDAKDSELAEEIAKLREEMNKEEGTSAVTVVTLVIAIVSLMGNAALIAWGVISKRKKVSISAEAAETVESVTEPEVEPEAEEVAEAAEETEAAEEAETENSDEEIDG